MKYYGIDIHKKYSVYTAMDKDGIVLSRGEVPNEPKALAQIINRDGEGSKAVIEATCNWYYIYDLLEGIADEVCVAHPLHTKAIASARVKTDKVDSTTLAHLLRADLIPKSYIPPQEVRELRQLLRYRASLVRISTQVKNKIHAILIKNGLDYHFSDLFGRAGRGWLSQLRLCPVYQDAIQGYLRILDILQEEIKRANKEVDSQAKADPKVRLLVSIPGIGPYSALTILSEIGDVHRFPNSTNLVSYAGLATCVHSSGGITRYGSITKEGSPWLRWILTQAAHVAVRRPGYLQEYYRRIAFKKGKNTAIIAVARKILVISYYLLKRGEFYRG